MAPGPQARAARRRERAAPRPQAGAHPELGPQAGARFALGPQVRARFALGPQVRARFALGQLPPWR
ncbi:MAG TPA: hypothetical protein VF414_11255, partial [Thermoanaerobaculia bacterium]